MWEGGGRNVEMYHSVTARYLAVDVWMKTLLGGVTQIYRVRGQFKPLTPWSYKVSGMRRMKKKMQKGSLHNLPSPGCHRNWWLRPWTSCEEQKSSTVHLVMLKCCFTSTETVGLLGTGAQDVHLDFHTAPEFRTLGDHNAVKMNRMREREKKITCRLPQPLRTTTSKKSETLRQWRCH